MSQKQLLLVILVTIVTGIAAVVIFNTIDSAADATVQDAARQDLENIGISARNYFKQPALLGGGGDSFEDLSFDVITFGAEEVTDGGFTASNTNGTYTFSAPDDEADNFVVTATVSDSDSSRILARVCIDTIVIAGLNAESVAPCP